MVEPETSTLAPPPLLLPLLIISVLPDPVEAGDGGPEKLKQAPLSSISPVVLEAPEEDLAALVAVELTWWWWW